MRVEEGARSPACQAALTASEASVSLARCLSRSFFRFRFR